MQHFPQSCYTNSFLFPATLTAVCWRLGLLKRRKAPQRSRESVWKTPKTAIDTSPEAPAQGAGAAIGQAVGVGTLVIGRQNPAIYRGDCRRGRRHVRCCWCRACRRSEEASVGVSAELSAKNVLPSTGRNAFVIEPVSDILLALFAHPLDYLCRRWKRSTEVDQL